MKAKRIFGLFLTLILIISALPIGIFAEEVSSNEAEDIAGVLQKPCFESLEFSPTAFTTGTWVNAKTYEAEKLEYDLPIKTYSTSHLTLQATTVYDTDKYTAVAEYVDAADNSKRIEINSKKITYLDNIAFGESILKISIYEKENNENKTVYTFKVKRPRDKTKSIKANGISLLLDGRSISQTLYNGNAEGSMQKCDENGTINGSTGVTGSCYFYRSFVYEDIDKIKLSIAASTAYAHIRYCKDGDSEWRTLSQGGGITELIDLEDGDTRLKIQIIDDETYTENLNKGSNGFEAINPLEYNLWISRVGFDSPQILSAEASSGDMYPLFNPEMFSYWVITDSSSPNPVMRFKAEAGCSVKVGNELLEPDENGSYSIALETSQKAVTVLNAEGLISNIYKFGYKKKSALDVPDRVVDYLCIGSQYTNLGYGSNPELSLTGTLISLGNFGGYITYYYENPLTDNPYNKYGMDFYVIGNSYESNIDSMAELGQVYVSEDGKSWYALAGSEHYEDKAIWDYTITYRKGEDGKSYWSDSCGNSMDYAAPAWPNSKVYYMNDVGEEESYSFTGVVFKSQLGSIMGDSSSTFSFAASSKFGYTDYYASNVIGTAITEVNPYTAKPSKSNGFDLAWAVDEKGNPVDVKDKKFHYVRVATASNIYAGAFKEKSTEVKYVVRTTPQIEEVGKTSNPAEILISDGIDTIVLKPSNERNIYSINVGDMKYITLLAKGEEGDNIYINNERVESNQKSRSFKITSDSGERLIRIITQNGDKQPSIILLKVEGSSKESDDLLESIKLNVGGKSRFAENNGEGSYSISVGSKINSVKIMPVADSSVDIKINGEELKEEYELVTGDNSFEVLASKDGLVSRATLTVYKEPSTAVEGKIKVYFTLLGDSAHGDNGNSHTYKDRNLVVWIPKTAIEIESPATVLEVFEKAVEGVYSFKNDGGNYISEIDGLSEFDNGPLSGWMYTLNGEHSSKGVAEQSVKKGDSIVFHYTDDYTKEEGSEKWSSASTVNKEEAIEDEAIEDENPIINQFDENVFTDVDKESWYYEPVKFVYERGLMKGSKESFEPETKLSRAMLVTILYRLENPEEKSYEINFEDINPEEWYAKAVAWAAVNNIVNGISSTEFAPNEEITREQLAVMLYRYAKAKDLDIKEFSDFSGYEDYQAISSWALDAMSWANKTELISGVSNNLLMPEGDATRAQVAIIIMRFCKNIIK